MLVTFIAKKNKKTTVDIPSVPRVGDEVVMSNMTHMYDDETGESPVWVVKRVEWHLESIEDSLGNRPDRFYGILIYLIYIENEEG